MLLHENTERGLVAFPEFVATVGSCEPLELPFTNFRTSDAHAIEIEIVKDIHTRDQ